MKLPRPITTNNPDFDRLTQSISLELFHLREIHTLDQAGKAHHSNRKDAINLMATIHHLLDQAALLAPDDDAEGWLVRAGYVAQLMSDEIHQREQVA